MHNLNKLNKLSKRIESLLGEPPPTFQEFKESWEKMDSLSKSLFETALSAPDLIGVPRNFELLKGYLRRLGVNPEPIDTKNLIESLESDDD